MKLYEEKDIAEGYIHAAYWHMLDNRGIKQEDYFNTLTEKDFNLLTGGNVHFSEDTHYGEDGVCDNNAIYKSKREVRADIDGFLYTYRIYDNIKCDRDVVKCDGWIVVEHEKDCSIRYQAVVMSALKSEEQKEKYEQEITDFYRFSDDMIKNDEKQHYTIGLIDPQQYAQKSIGNLYYRELANDEKQKFDNRFEIKSEKNISNHIEKVRLLSEKFDSQKELEF